MSCLLLYYTIFSHFTRSLGVFWLFWICISRSTDYFILLTKCYTYYWGACRETIGAEFFFLDHPIFGIVHVFLFIFCWIIDYWHIGLNSWFFIESYYLVWKFICHIVVIVFIVIDLYNWFRLYCDLACIREVFSCVYVSPTIVACHFRVFWDVGRDRCHWDLTVL